MLDAANIPLPTAPRGYMYRWRTFPDQKTSQGTYNGYFHTTGLFAQVSAHSPSCKDCKGASCAKQAHLVRVAALILDFDLCDSYAHHSGTTSPKEFKQEALRIKTLMHAGQIAVTPDALRQLAETAEHFAYRASGMAPSAVVSSGYGVHLYFWLKDHQGYNADILLAREKNRELVHSINALAGFKFADDIHDAGTRLLRTPGTMNRKGLVSQPCHTLKATYANRVDIHALQIFRSTPQGQPANQPAARPAQTGGQGHSGDSLFVQADDIYGLMDGVRDATSASGAKMATDCPVFSWARINPGLVGRQTWRGMATNLFAVLGEAGRESFHAISQLDSGRYDESETDDMFDMATASGPMSYHAFGQNGDWPGNGDATQHASPAQFARSLVVVQPLPSGQTLGEVSEAKAVARAAQISSEVPGLALSNRGLIARCDANCRKILRHDPRYSDNLRFNQMDLSVEHNGERQEDEFFGKVVEYLMDQYGVDFGRMSVAQTVLDIAKERKYHPVREWLEDLPLWDGEDRTSWLLTEGLHAEDTQLHRAYIRCFLIGAVARGLCYDPRGVKNDSMLIFQGHQGAGKSMFFNHLIPKEWVSDSELDPGSKDAAIAIQGCWIVELAEFERTGHRSSVAAVKAWLTSAVDKIRLPYARTESHLVRRSVFVGSTNEDEFLMDPTGARRFHPLPVGTFSSLARAARNKALLARREQIWAQAVSMYMHHRETGAESCQWWLTDEEAAMQRVESDDFRVKHPWEETVLAYLSPRHASAEAADISIEKILMDVLGLEIHNLDRGNRARVRNILVALGWERRRVRRAGKRQYRWFPGIHAVTQEGPLLSLVVGGAQT